VLLLLDVWKEVVRKRPGALLAVIGNGKLEREMREKIARLGLAPRIEMLGFLNGEPKYEVFKQSKIVLHPATYDSGGMAAAEAMAWGLPGVSFDLESLRTYYPKGMIKVAEVGEVTGFAREVLSLLADEARYRALQEDALTLIRETWKWERRDADIWAQTSLYLGGQASKSEVGDRISKAEP